MARSRRSDDAAPPARPAPPCADCGAPAFLPCARCGKPLCADHGLTRLLITLCAECAAGQPGQFRSHVESAQAAVAARLAAPAGFAAAAPRPVLVRRVARPPRGPTGDPAAPGAWGKVGTAAELTKRLLMAGPATDVEVHARLVQQLGAAAAGPPKNVPWYRNWLKRAGYAVPAGEGG